MDERFETIAERFLAEARVVECTVPEFMLGLHGMIQLISEEIVAAREGWEEDA